MENYQEFREDSPDQISVRGFLHRPLPTANDCLVLTHGAGSNCESPLLVWLANAFCDSGLTVLRCDLAFRQSRPHGPPPRGGAERDQQGLRAAVASMRALMPGRIFLGGHSYGGRQASMLAAEEPGIADRLLLLSYPLHPPQRPAELRTAHFPRLRVPGLFVHGTRDGFASIDELASALALIDAPTQLLPVEGAGHELLPKQNRDAFVATIAKAFLSFAGAVAEK